MSEPASASELPDSFEPGSPFDVPLTHSEMNVRYVMLNGTGYKVTHPEPMTPEQRQRMRQAARMVFSIYAEPVANMLCNDFIAWEEFGYRFGGHSTIFAAVDAIHAQYDDWAEKWAEKQRGQS